MNWTLLRTLVGCALVATSACGSQAESPPRYHEEVPGVTLRFQLQWEDAQRLGTIEQDEDREPLIDETVRALATRVNPTGSTSVSVVGHGDSAIDVLLPWSLRSEATVEAYKQVVSATGVLTFNVEVRPTGLYDAPSAEAPRLRTKAGQPWPGTREEFDDYKASEVAVWRAARAAGDSYIATDSRYRVALRAGRSGESDADFLVVEAAQGKQDRFDARAIINPRIAQHPETREPIVLMDIAPARQADFHAFTSRNLHLPLAIVLNGEVHAAPIINTAIRGNLQYTLGPASRKEGERQAEQVLTALRTGQVRVPLRLAEVTMHERSFLPSTPDPRGVKSLVAQYLRALATSDEEEVLRHSSPPARHRIVLLGSSDVRSWYEALDPGRSAGESVALHLGVPRTERPTVLERFGIFSIREDQFPVEDRRAKREPGDDGDRDALRRLASSPPAAGRVAPRRGYVAGIADRATGKEYPICILKDGTDWWIRIADDME